MQATHARDGDGANGLAENGEKRELETPDRVDGEHCGIEAVSHEILVKLHMDPVEPSRETVRQRISQLHPQQADVEPRPEAAESRAEVGDGDRHLDDSVDQRRPH